MTTVPYCQIFPGVIGESIKTPLNIQMSGREIQQTEFWIYFYTRQIDGCKYMVETLNIVFSNLLIGIFHLAITPSLLFHEYLPICQLPINMMQDIPRKVNLEGVW